MLSRRRFLAGAGSGAALMLLSGKLLALDGLTPPVARTGDTIVVYLTPTCGCCAKWVEHLRQAGFDVTVEKVADVDPTKKKLNVPGKLWSCHTAVAGPYAIEGHVPASAIQRLLRERPAVAGIAVAAMPMGSPGMEHGDHKEPFDVLSFTCCGDIKVFAKG